MSSLVAGSRVGRYVIVRALGSEGGSSLAYDPALERSVALEVVDAREEPERARTTLATARALSKLASPHVPRVHVGGADDDLVWVAQEHEPSIGLSAWLSRPREARATRRILAAALRGLTDAHARGIVHGDVVADRVRVGVDGRGWIEGFGARPDASPEDDRRAFAALLADPAIGRSRGIEAARAALRRGDSSRAADELEGIAARHRRRTLALGIGVLSTVGAIVAWDASVRARAGLCRDAESKLAGAWDDTLRAEVATAFAATGTPYAEAARSEVARRLDAQATAWSEAYEEACRATHVDRVADEDVLDLRMRCLLQRHEELAALSGVLARADRDVVARAVDATRGLRSPSACMDAEALARRTPPAPAESEAAAVARLRARMSEARALVAAGRYAEADTLVAELDREAQDIEHAGTRAELTALGGQVAGQAGRASEAVDRLLAGIAAAWRAGHDELAADTWTEVVYVVAERLGDPEAALTFSEHGHAALERLGGDPRLEGALALTTGIALGRLYRHGEAVARFELALARIEATDDPDPIAAASVLNNLGIAHRELGHLDEALAHYRSALALAEPLLGPDHPQIASFLGNLGAVRLEQGKPAETLDLWTRAHEIQRVALGPDHPGTLITRDNIGLALHELGRHDEALTTLRETLALRESVLEPDHPAVGVSLVHIANVLVDLGELAEAEATADRALGLLERRFGPDHLWVAHARTAVARVAVVSGRPDDAVAQLERAVAARERAFGPMGSGLASDLVELAHAALDADRIALARESLERARKLPGSTGEPALDFGLARLRWHDGDPVGARTAARQVRERIAGGETSRIASVTAIDAWLSAHP